MTAVTQTEAFSKLDEGTVKDFITKVLFAWTVKTSFVDPDPNWIRQGFNTKVLCAWTVKTSFVDPDPNWIRIQSGQ
jgi:hypothetical protein